MAEDEGPERTSDGRWIVVDGRRWRATDPGIPEALRAELVAELMRARRLVRLRGDEVRPFVQDAKVALGERGEPWWETPSDSGRRERLAATMRALLRKRDGSTICPSEAARVVGGQEWRELMDVAREVVDDLAAADEAVAQQKGEPVRATEARGPIRVAPGPSLQR